MPNIVLPIDNMHERHHTEFCEFVNCSAWTVPFLARTVLYRQIPHVNIARQTDISMRYGLFPKHPSMAVVPVGQGFSIVGGIFTEISGCCLFTPTFTHHEKTGMESLAV